MHRRLLATIFVLLGFIFGLASAILFVTMITAGDTSSVSISRMAVYFLSAAALLVIASREFNMYRKEKAEEARKRLEELTKSETSKV